MAHTACTLLLFRAGSPSPKQQQGCIAADTPPSLNRFGNASADLYFAASVSCVNT
ncbi:hypothetical protein [Geitlerinema sp. P-1104]|uniref:hypothetical protein n=1 Tax=Geitlerinema sp. P-1104 TaxID=2546230 RepID=UPI0014778619|nr:hypothetical protein [Geitlerinema sp. P-1104]